MSKSYAAPLPVDQYGHAMVDAPAPETANARYANCTTVSSVVTLTDNTSVVDMAAIGMSSTGVMIKWIGAGDTVGSVTSANFDHAIPAGWRQRFIVPIETVGNSASIVGVNPSNGLYKRLAWASIGSPAASVFAAEF